MPLRSRLQQYITIIAVAVSLAMKRKLIYFNRDSNESERFKNQAQCFHVLEVNGMTPDKGVEEDTKIYHPCSCARNVSATREWPYTTCNMTWRDLGNNKMVGVFNCFFQISKD